MFKHIITSIIGTILMLGTTGLYFYSFFEETLREVSWKHLLFPFLLGLFLIFAKDNDILYPLKVLINKFIKKP